MASSAVFEPVDPAFFAAFVAASADLAVELRLKVSSAGVECRGFDPGMVAVVEWRIGAEYFKRLDAEGLVTVDVNGPDFTKALRGLEKKDSLVVTVSDAQVAVGVTREGSRLRRCVARMEYSPPEKVPRLPPASINAVISARGFAAAVKEVADVNDRATIGTGGGALLFSCENELRQAASYALDPINPGEKVEGAGSGRFGVEYLKRIGGLSSTFALIKLSWNPDGPLEAVYEFPGAWARYVLAPVVQND